MRLEGDNVQIMYINIILKKENVTQTDISFILPPTLRHTSDCGLLFSPHLQFGRGEYAVRNAAM